MSHLPLRRGPPSAGRLIEARKTPGHGLVATLADSDLIAVVTFCVLGLLAAFNVILRFPDLGALIEQYNQF
jgi:hypothetical protein